jgi:UDP-glucose 4-epimerase
LKTIGGLVPEAIYTRLKNNYSGKSAVVTGGASFIGSHLTDALLELGASVKVLDDFSSGRKENLTPHANLQVVELDVLNAESVKAELTSDFDVVFHLAAVHGGRGFIESQQAAIMENFALDFNVFSAAAKAGVGRIVHASSACAYPVSPQSSTTDLNLLFEGLAGFDNPEKSDPDGAYGWVKLMGEYQLERICETSEKSSGASARIFTAYGERENESHAAIALIAKSLLKMDPYPVWGSGQQTRNFTYVADTVTGLLLLGLEDKGSRFDVFNVGTADHVTVMAFIEEINQQLGWSPIKFDLQLDKPMGVASRASNNSKMMSKFAWAPGISIQEGIKRTLAWYTELDSRPSTISELEAKLNAR